MISLIWEIIYFIPPCKTKKSNSSSNIRGRKPSGNIQKGSAETIFVDPNTQLQSSNQNNNPASASSIEDNINIDTVEKIIEIPTNKALASIKCQQDVDNLYNTYSMLTLTLSKLFALIEVEKQIFMLEKRKHKLHTQLKLKFLLEKETEDFPLLTVSSLFEQTISQ